MAKKYAVLLLICIFGEIPPATVAQDTRSDAKAVVAAAAKAMGADKLNTLRFSAMGSYARSIGQNINPSVAWPVVRVKSYTYETDFNRKVFRSQLVDTQNGADGSQTEYVSDTSPWNSQFQFWLSPFAFLRAASSNGAAVQTQTIDGIRYSVVTVTVGGKYKLVGYINDQNLVEKVQTWIDSDVMGDMLAEAWFTVYKDFDGVKFPTSIVEREAGFPILILGVSEVKPNAAVNIQPESTATSAASSAPRVVAEKIGDGVWSLTGGTHHSVAVEFADYVTIVEAPLNEQRSLAVIAEAKARIPNKPIRYLINTHHHFDHSGGLRTFVDEGTIIITHESNRAFFEKALSSPRTLNPDRLARSGKKPVIETVSEKKVLTDGVRSLEIHLVKDNPHADGVLLVFLQKEKIVVEADVFTPPDAAGRTTASLVDNLETLKLDFERIVPLHGSGASRADLYAALRKPVPDIAEILARKAPAAGQRGQRGQAAGGNAVATDDRAKQVLETACTACHNLNRVETKNLSEADWKLVVDRMKSKGAEISDEDAPVLTSYLAKTYGPK